MEERKDWSQMSVDEIMGEIQALHVRLDAVDARLGSSGAPGADNHVDDAATLDGARSVALQAASRELGELDLLSAAIAEELGVELSIPLETATAHDWLIAVQSRILSLKGGGDAASDIDPATARREPLSQVLAESRREANDLRMQLAAARGLLGQVASCLGAEPPTTAAGHQGLLAKAQDAQRLRTVVTRAVAAVENLDDNTTADDALSVLNRSHVAIRVAAGIPEGVSD